MANQLSTTISLGKFYGEYGPVEWAINDGIVFPLTPCCGASAKGMELGLACRACYGDIPDWFGMAFTVADLVSGRAAPHIGEKWNGR